MNKIKQIWFREYAPPPGAQTRVQMIDFGPNSSFSAKEGPHGITVTSKQAARFYPWSTISWVDYGLDNRA